ncbi:MAG: cell division ATPase MinD [Candidatus Aenigmatarchaeota archaeon]
MVRIIDVCSGKGGVGKTTVAANLGIALQKFYKKVAVIDCNLTTSHLGLLFNLYSYPVTLNNFLRNEAKIEDAIYIHSSGLRIVPASLDFREIVNIDTINLKQKLKNTFYDYDFVFLDSAPSLGKESLIALQASDEALFVANPHIPSLVDVVKCYQLINTLEDRPTPIGIILNRVRNKPYEIKLEEVKQFTDLPVLGVIPEDEKILESMNKKTLVTISHQNRSSSIAFFEIAAKLAGLEYKRPNFFKRLIGKLKK